MDVLKTNGNVGDVFVRRKMDTVQIVRDPSEVLATLVAEEAIKLAHALLHDADIILKATAPSADIE